MNIASYLQDRQYGFFASKRSRLFKDDQLGKFLDEKTTESMVNKACSVSGTCRSTFIMEFSPDGTKVASTHGDHSVRITDIATGQCARTLQGHPRTPWCLAYHPSSSHILASGCLGGQVRIWDLYGYGCEVWQSESSSVIASLTFHPTDHVLVIGTGNSLYFWDWSQPEPFTKCSTLHEYERIRWVKFDRLGHNLYTGISNNTVLQRDEVSSVSLTSQNPTPTPRQPSRLNNVYSRIINYYQEYRRERLAHETSTGQEAGSSSQSNTQEADPFPGVQNIDIIEPRSPSNVQSFDRHRSDLTNPGSTSTNQLTQLSDGYSRTVPDSQSSSNLLINPNNDPFLPTVSYTSASETVAVSRGVGSFSGQSLTINTSVSGPSVLPSLNRNLQRETSLQNLDGDSTHSSDEDTMLHTRNSTVNGEDSTNRSTRMGNNRIIEKNNASCSSTSTSNVLSQNNSMTNRLDDSVQALSESIRSSFTSCSDINPYLARYLKTQASRKNTQTTTLSTTQPTKTFPSIRDRLKINIPLSSQSGSNLGATNKLTGIPPVTVLLNKQVTGVPPVTVLSGNRDIGGSNPSSRMNGVQPVTVLSGNRDIGGSNPSSRMTGVPPVTVLSGNRDIGGSNPSSRMTGVPPVTVLSGNRDIGGSNPSSRMTGVPPVTVLSGNRDTGGPKPTSRMTGMPPVTVLSGNQETSLTPASVMSNREVTGVPPVTVLQSSNLSTHPTVQPTAIPQVCVLFSPSSGPSQSILESHNSDTVRTEEIPTSVTECTNVTSESSITTDVDSSVVSSENCTPGSQYSTDSILSASSNPEDNQNLGASLEAQNVFTNSIPLRPYSSTSASSNTSSNQNPLRRIKHPVTRHVNLFENVQRARYQRKMRNSCERNQPYRLPTPHRSLSLMGPYLASRGFMGSDSLMGSSAGDSGAETNRTTSNDISSQESRKPGCNNETNKSANVSNSSLSNKSAPISNSNMPYFLPISDYSSESSSDHRTVSEINLDSGQRIDHDSDNQSIELVVDQNENYTAVRNANTVQTTQPLNEVQVGNNDDNNNSLHIVQQPDTNVTVTSSSTSNQSDRDYLALRNTFVSMTDQIEREMSDLNRRINALRDSFNRSLFSLRQDRQRFESVGQGVEAVLSGDGVTDDQTASGNRPSRRLPVIVTDESQSDENETDDIDTQGFMIQPPTLLETSLRSHRRGRQGRFLQRPMLEEAAEPQDWRQLQRHYLHPHYSASIFDETINRPSNAIQSAINRAIAGAFMGTGESAVANNIINQTHRIQRWDFTKCHIPDITSCEENVVVLHCKLHNSASCDISPNGALLATFVPSHHGFPDDNILAVYSILPDNIGQCLYTKSFGPNAISISISPSNKHVLVGLAAKKLSWVFTARQMVAQIYKLDKEEAGEKSTKLVKDIFHTCSSDIRSQVSGNSARWLPLVGQGLVYGTNRGHLNFCKPGVKTAIRKIGSTELQNYELSEENVSETSRRFTLRRVPWLTHTDPHRVSASTQTPADSHTTATQTETDSRESQI